MDPASPRIPHSPPIFEPSFALHEERRNPEHARKRKIESISKENQNHGSTHSCKRTRAITSCQNVVELLRVWKNEGHVFDHFNFLALFSSLSKRKETLSLSQKKVIQEMQTSVIDKIAQFANWQLTILLNACSKLPINTDNLLQAVQEELLFNDAVKIKALKAGKLALLAHVFAHATHDTCPLYHAIQCELLCDNENKLYRCEMKDLCFLSYGYAAQGWQDVALFRALERRLHIQKEPLVTQAPTKDLSMLCHAVAKLRVGGDAFFDMMLEILKAKGYRKLEMSNSKDLGMFIYAFSTIQPIPMWFFAQAHTLLLDRYRQDLVKSSGGELAIVANAYSRVGYLSPDLMFAIYNELKKNDWKKLKECSPQDLALLANCYHKLESPPREILIEIEHELLHDEASKLKQCKSIELAMIAHALAQVGSAELFALIESSLLHQVAPYLRANAPRPPVLSGQEIAMFCLGFNRPNRGSNTFYEALAKCFIPHEANLQDLAIVADCFSSQRLYAPSLLKHIEQALFAENERKLRSGSPLDFCMLTRAFAKLGFVSEALFGQISRLIRQEPERYSLYHLLNIGWAFAVNGHVEDSLFALILQRAPLEIARAPLSETDATQLLQIFLALRYESRLYKTLIPTAIHHEVANIQRFLENFTDDGSEFLQSFLPRLADVYPHVRGNMMLEGLLAHIYLPASRLVIDLCGTNEYLQGTAHLTGPALFKQRLLQKMYLRVAVVPYWEWTEAQRSHSEYSYIRHLLNK